MDAVDNWIPLPPRDIDKPFLMPVEDVFSITGRGTVATGRVEAGIIKVGDEVEILGLGEDKKSVVTVLVVLKLVSSRLVTKLKSWVLVKTRNQL